MSQGSARPTLAGGCEVRRGTNTIESYKEPMGGDGVLVRQDLPRLIREGHERMSAADKDLLKWLGIFFRKPTPGKFMMRIRMPNGFATSSQLSAIAHEFAWSG